MNRESAGHPCFKNCVAGNNFICSLYSTYKSHDALRGTLNKRWQVIPQVEVINVQTGEDSHAVAIFDLMYLFVCGCVSVSHAGGEGVQQCV